MRALRGPEAPAKGGITAAGFVAAAYQGVLRRPPDATGARAFTRALESGRMTPLDILNTFIESAEFQAWEPRPLDAYDPAADPLLAPYRAPPVQGFSRALEAAANRGGERFERLYADALTATTGADRDYLVYHQRRFRELLGAATLLMDGRQTPQILEVGSSVLTGWWGEFMAGAQVTTLSAPGVGSPAGNRNVNVDLNLDLPPADTGRFDLVLFCEVLEHLQTDAVWVVGGLLDRLKADGLLYLTTPNLYRASSLAAVSERRNLQAPFPRENSGRHHHMREFCMGELLEIVTAAGGEVRGWYWSDCWDSGFKRPHERANLVLVAGRAAG